MANLYTGTPDLRWRVETTPWADIIPALEAGFTDDHELAPASLEDAVEQIGMVLELTGQMCADDIAPHAAEVDRIGARLVDGKVLYPEPMQRGLRMLAEAGLMGLTVPRRYGGMNMPITAYTAAVELVGAADASVMTVFALQGCGETIHRYGTPELCERYLPRMCAGEITACMALTEPNAGSELGAVSTRAVVQPDGTWRVSGSKCFITNGGSELMLTLARTEEAPGGQGLSLLLVERGPGVEVPKLEEKLGIHGSPTAVINFDDAPGWLLGNRGDGLYRCTLGLLHNVRLEVASQAVGIAQAAQAQAARYASEREQFQRSIDHFAPVRDMLFRNAVQLEAARAIIFHTAHVVDRRRGAERTGDTATVEHLEHLADLLTPLSKYYACEIVNEVASRALQVHGGYGYSREYPVERNFRDARITNIYEGTSEIQAGAMIVPLVKGGLQRLFDERFASAKEPASCAGVLGRLHDAYVALQEAGTITAKADRFAQQGWSRHFADVTAELFSGLVFLQDAAGRERSAVLARYQAAEALRNAQALVRRVRDGERTPFDEDSFTAVVEPYRSGG